MSEPYEELIDGEWTLRLPPRPSHESICRILHQRIGQVVDALTSSRLLPSRSQVVFSETRQFRPDLSVVTAATGKVWLAVEIINPEDHHADTVIKKEIYGELRVPRLWLIDPRYENVEIYHAGTYGLSLRETLMVREVLVEPLLPGLSLEVKDLFLAPPARKLGDGHDF